MYKCLAPLGGEAAAEVSEMEGWVGLGGLSTVGEDLAPRLMKVLDLSRL